MRQQVSRTLLSIQANLNNVVVYVVSILLPISNTFSLFLKALRTVPSGLSTTGITVAITAFSVLSQDPSICPSFRFLSFSFCSPVEWQNPLDNIFYHFIFWEFFTSVFADGFSVESEWHQVSSGFKDSSQYSGRCQHCCNLDDFHSFCPFPTSPAPLSKPLKVIPNALIIFGITETPMIRSFLCSLIRSKYLFLFSLSLIFSLWSAGTAKSTIQQVPPPFF